MTSAVLGVSTVHLYTHKPSYTPSERQVVIMTRLGNCIVEAPLNTCGFIGVGDCDCPSVGYKGVIEGATLRLPDKQECLNVWARERKHCDR